MSDLINSLSLLFAFLFNQLGTFANFFVTNTLGNVILGLITFSILVYLLIYILRNLR